LKCFAAVSTPLKVLSDQPFQNIIWNINANAEYPKYSGSKNTSMLAGQARSSCYTQSFNQPSRILLKYFVPSKYFNLGSRIFLTS
jgi:hypothetical protein